VEPLVVQPQPAGDLPGDIAPQRADRLPVTETFQGLQHTLAGNIGEQLRREQLVAVVGRKAYADPSGTR
jgi:hypothetical protein